MPFAASVRPEMVAREFARERAAFAIVWAVRGRREQPAGLRPGGGEGGANLN
jgi:hypothetical protein